jgi:hypothetical protein
MIVNNKLVSVWKETTNVSYCATIHVYKKKRENLIQEASSGKYSNDVLDSFITKN